MRTIDREGMRVGNLTVVAFTGKSRNRKRVWLCQCDCGGRTEITDFGGSIWNCGCTNRLNGPIKHGFASTKSKPTPEYTTYKNMLARCTQRHPERAKYFERGISVCDRWRNGDGFKPGFLCFLEDVGPKPKDGRYSLDRIDNDRGYEPGNCRWASYKQQARNTRSNHYVLVRGQRLSLIEACERLGVCYSKMRYRLNRVGLSFEQALIDIRRRAA